VAGVLSTLCVEQPSHVCEATGCGCRALSLHHLMVVFMRLLTSLREIGPVMCVCQTMHAMYVFNNFIVERCWLTVRRH